MSKAEEFLELFGELTPEERKKAVEEYQRHKKLTRENNSAFIAEKGFTKKDFTEILKFAHKMYEPQFEAIRQATHSKHLGMGEFYDSSNKFANGLGRQVANQEPNIGLQELYAQYVFWLHNEKIYSIHQNLCSRFKATNIKSIPVELLRLPFPAFKIQVPNDVIPFTTFEKQKISIREIIVSDCFDAEIGRYLYVFHRNCDDVGFFKIAINKNEVHECVEAAFEEMTATNDKMAELSKDTLPFSEEESSELRNMFEFIMKVILYVTGANVDVRWVDETKQLQMQLSRANSNKKKVKLQHRLNNAKRMYLVGHSIVLSREEKIMYENLSKGLWKLSFRFVVQGHWRNQAFGKGMSERKHIFIDPFWKGPSYAEMVNNPHLVK